MLREEVIEERFQYETLQGVHIAFVRIFRLDPPVSLPNEKKYGGCRSWIELPEIVGSTLVSVLSDEEHTRRYQFLQEKLGL